MSASLISIGRFVGVLVDVQRSGDTVRLAGYVRDDLDAVAVQQFTGLLDNHDEPVMPVVCEARPDLTGFYRPGGGTINERRGLTKLFGRWEWAIDLTRIAGGYGDPLHELWVLAAKTNDVEFSFTFTDRAHSAVYLPATFKTQSLTLSASGVRTAADGVALNARHITLNGGESTTIAWTHLATPTVFYDAGVKVEQLVSWPWQVVIGRQVPAQSTLRVSNDLVRVSVATDGEVTVESWDGAAWRSKKYRITYDSGAGNITSIHAATVRTNGPDECVVSWIGNTDDDGGATISARLLRGELLAEISVASNAAQVWKLTRSTTEAGTVLQDEEGGGAGVPADIGVRATANDANGDRYVIVSREDLGEGSVDTTNGGWTSGITIDPYTGFGVVSTSAVWGVGLEVGGSGAVAPNDAYTMSDRFQILRSLVRSVST